MLLLVRKMQTNINSSIQKTTTCRIILEPYPKPVSPRKMDRADRFKAKIERRLQFRSLHLGQPAMEMPENMPTIHGASGGDESNLLSPYLVRILREVVLRILAHSPCTGRKLGIVGEYIRSDDFGEMIRRLVQLTLTALCILLLLYPTEQLLAQFELLLENLRRYWDITAFVGTLYFGVYVVDRLRLYDVAVILGIQPAVTYLFYGMNGVMQYNIEAEMDSKPAVSLLIAGMSSAIIMGVFAKNTLDKWVPQYITETETEQLTTNHFNTTIQTNLTGALTLQETFWDILWIFSKCLNYILQTMANGVLVLAHFPYTRKTVKETILIIAEPDSLQEKRDEIFERLAIVRAWIKIYFWILYFYDIILELFPGNQDAIGLLSVHYGLGILSMGLTYCYMKYFK